MSNEPSSPKIADIVSMGMVAAISGISAISVLFRYPVVAFLVGAIGILSGVTTLRMDVEKLDKVFAVIGIILSIVPMIYPLAIFVQ